jgi:hypothetical protein
MRVVRYASLHLNLGSVVKKKERDMKMSEAPVLNVMAGFINLKEYITQKLHLFFSCQRRQ